jgi:hypothetical protein
MNDPVSLNNHITTSSEHRQITSISKKTTNYTIELSKEIERRFCNEHEKPTQINVNSEKILAYKESSGLDLKTIARRSKLHGNRVNKILRGGICEIVIVRKLCKVIGARLNQIGKIIK